MGCTPETLTSMSFGEKVPRTSGSSDQPNIALGFAAQDHYTPMNIRNGDFHRYDARFDDQSKFWEPAMVIGQAV